VTVTVAVAATEAGAVPLPLTPSHSTTASRKPDAHGDRHAL